jgi:hypothetical protein
MRHFIAFALSISFITTVVACEKTSCDTPSETLAGDVTENNTSLANNDAEDAEENGGEPGIPPCPGLNCTPEGGCNTDYPYCCNKQCQKNPCDVSGAP